MGSVLARLLGSAVAKRAAKGVAKGVAKNLAISAATGLAKRQLAKKPKRRRGTAGAARMPAGSNRRRGVAGGAYARRSVGRGGALLRVDQRIA
jgi:hypothetical protein